MNKLTEWLVKPFIEEEFGAPAGMLPSQSQKKIKKAKKRLDKTGQRSVYSVSEIEENLPKIKKVVGIYGGRFQPFGPHHLKTYQWLSKQVDDAYITTSNIKQPPRHPMNFNEKVRHMVKMGVPKNRIIQEKSPYVAKNVLKKYDKDTTAVIYIFGAKDAGRLKGGKYFQDYKKNKNNLEPAWKHGYILTAPHVSVKVGGKEVSGTVMRQLLGSPDYEKDREKLFKKAFGYFDKGIFTMMNNKFKKLFESIDEFILKNDIKQIIKESTTALSPTDDGPPTFYRGFDDYKKFSKQWINGMYYEMGWELINYILGKHAVNPDYDYTLKYTTVPAVAYGRKQSGDYGSRFGTSNPIQSYKDYIEGTVLRDIGYEVIKWMGITPNGKKYTGVEVETPVLPGVGDPRNNTANTEVDKKDELEERINLDKEVQLLIEGGAYLDEDTGLVMCVECNKWMGQIQYRHLKYAHNMTMEEYRYKYPFAPLLAESAKNTMKTGKNPMQNKEVRKKHLMVMTSKEYKNNHSKIMTGKGVGVKRPDVSEKNKTTHRELMFDRGDWTRPEDKPKYQRYTEEVRLLTDKNYQKYFDEIPNSFRGRDKTNWHLDHKFTIHDGFKNNIPPEVIAHHSNLSVIPASDNISKNYRSNILIDNLIGDIRKSSNPLDNRILLLCGGAYGHMNHPFDDKNLTFSDLKQIIINGLGGKLNREDNVTEKLDGQNLMVSWVNGKLVTARNKGQLKNFGATAMDTAGVASKFAGRGDIKNAFVFAMKDLSKSIGKLSDKQKEKVFGNGKRWMNLEVIYPKSANVIDYDKTEIIFHGTLEYDESGKAIGQPKDSARMLAGMIKQVNQNVQKTYNIGKPQFLTVPKVQDFGKKKTTYLSRLKKLQNQYKLKDNDTLALYHQRFWEEFIFNAAKQMKYKIPNKVLINLTKRWAFFDKSYKIPMIKKDIDNKKFLDWVLSFDKKDHQKWVKDNMKPFEVLFFDVGAEILKNISGYLVASQDKAVQKIRKDVINAIKTVKSGGDVKKIETLKHQLSKLEKIGGLSSIVPSEGIVFKYKGKVYKFTGAFAPVNQIVGLLNF